MDENTRLLRAIVRLLAVQIAAGETPGVGRERSQKVNIKLLASAGLPASEIADLLGTTPNTVSVSLAKMKRDRFGKKSRAAKSIKALPAPDPDGDGNIDDPD